MTTPARNSAHSRVTVDVTLTLDIDQDAWCVEYGLDPENVVEDVRRYVTTTIHNQLYSLELGELSDEAGRARSTGLPMPPPRPASVQVVWGESGHRLVHRERRRQIEVEGYTRDHDRREGADVLAQAAACYHHPDSPEALWPGSAEAWKPRDTLSNLVRAGALYLAALEVVEHTGDPDRAADMRGQTELVIAEIDDLLGFTTRLEMSLPPGGGQDRETTS